MERILSLDMSSKTGWAFALSSDDGFVLVDYGKIEKISEPDGEPYPCNYVLWANLCFAEIEKLINKFMPTVLVIEETAGGSKSAFSQKILEFIHFLMAQYIRFTGINRVYFQTETWRRVVGCMMTKEEKARNKVIRAAKEKALAAGNKSPVLVKGSDGKRIGKINKKHVNVRRANELFGKELREPFKMKDEDKADALLMAYAHHLRERMQDEHLG